MTNELMRKGFHLLELPIIFAYMLANNYWGKEYALYLLVGILVIVIIIEMFRLETKFNMPWPIGAIMRKKEEEAMASTVLFLASTILVFSVFKEEVALAVLLMATLGDASAAIFGKGIKSKNIYKNKTLSGTLACLITNLAVGLIILMDYPVIALIMAGSAAIIELISHETDDNLTVPILAGSIGQLSIIIQNIYF